MQAQSPLALVGDSFVLGLGGAGQQRYMATRQQDYPILATPQHLNDPIILSAYQIRLGMMTPFIFVSSSVARERCVHQVQDQFGR